MLDLLQSQEISSSKLLLMLRLKDTLLLRRDISKTLCRRPIQITLLRLLPKPSMSSQLIQSRRNHSTFLSTKPSKPPSRDQSMLKRRLEFKWVLKPEKLPNWREKSNSAKRESKMRSKLLSLSKRRKNSLPRRLSLSMTPRSRSSPSKRRNLRRPRPWASKFRRREPPSPNKRRNSRPSSRAKRKSRRPSLPRPRSK